MDWKWRKLRKDGKRKDRRHEIDMQGGKKARKREMKG